MDSLTDSASPDQPDGAFTLRDLAGAVHVLPGVEGMSLMEILRAADFAIPATCGGAAACGTCHVYVEETDLARLAPVGDSEQWQLEHLTAARPTSRLSCQLVWQKARLNGLSLTLAPQE
jgi:ferredoxin, 2Fe-2S